MTNATELRKQSFFKDAEGYIVIWQWPNIPLYGWIAFQVVSMVAPAGHLKTGAGHLSRAFLFAWALLEITQGVNYFRRLVGLLVMIALVLGFFKA